MHQLDQGSSGLAAGWLVSSKLMVTRPPPRPAPPAERIQPLLSSDPAELIPVHSS